MRLSRVRVLLLAAVVVAAVGAALAATHENASAQTPPVDTIATQLQPGWNLVGWMGPDTTTGEIFDAVPALQVVAAWDEDTERYIWARRGGAVPPELEPLTRGRALFLWLGGTGTVQWSRPASAEGMLLSLPPGYSLVGWAGLDGTPLSEAAGRFGSALVGVSTWNAETQEYERYTPGKDDSGEGTVVLNHGDALWVELSAERRWWQSRGVGPEFVFEGDVSEAEQAEHRAELAHVLAAFKERYDIEPPEFSVLVDPELDIAADAREGRIRVGAGAVDHSLRESAYAHEYFHILQFHLGQQPPSANGSPAWLTEGSARYTEDVYFRERQRRTDDRIRTAWWRGSLGVSEPLGALEDQDSFYAFGGEGYALGALATDWLVRRVVASSAADFAPFAPGGLELAAEYDAHLQYYEGLPSSSNWRQAFSRAFGISVDEFYLAFAEYRKAFGAARVPHLADEVDEPILVFNGGVPQGTADRLRAQFKDMQAFFRDRFEAGPVDYTVFVAADRQSATPLYVRVFGEDPERNFCTEQHTGIGFFMVLTCRPSLPDDVARHHFLEVTERLVPGRDVLEPYYWLHLATLFYIEAAYRDAAGIETFDQTRRREIAVARRTAQPLREMERFEDVRQSGNLGGQALSFLAGEWLARQAGESAILEFYRLLPSSANWRQAFLEAFRIAVDEFYERFEKYRREIVTPLPHLADEREEPVLVLLGGIPADTAADVQADFRALQSYFRDALGSGPADYTAYVVADRESAAFAHRNVFGEDPRPDASSCGGWSYGTGMFATLHCYDRLASDLAAIHFYDARDRLAPWRSLRPVPEGYGRWGPRWLQSATIGYMAHGGEVAAGRDTFDRLRQKQTALAERTRLPLRSMESEDGMEAAPRRAAEALSFLAGDWLVQRAGERALFEYFRLLPSSGSWRAAFEEAFEIGVEEFYAAFAEYRGDVVTPLPHLADDRDQPLLMFLGAIPEGTRAALRAKLGDVQTLFRERFDTGPVDYTLYIAAGLQSATDTYRRTVGRELTDLGCWQGEDGVVLFVVVTCATSPGTLDPIVEMHYDAVVLQLAPWASLPLASAVVGDRRGPTWLHVGTEQYVDAAYRAATAKETFEQTRNRLRIIAGRTEHPLPGKFQQIDDSARALTFLAADWLAQRAGEPALFEYYRLLPSSDSWQAAFEDAFGITVDDFYDEFEKYRATLTPSPVPPSPDDAAEPTLVFEGQIPAGTVARIRAQFEGVQAFFRDRLGGGPAGYTVFIAADRQAARAVYLREFGIEKDEPSCSSLGISSSVHILACDPSIVTVFASQHLAAAVNRLAPPGSLPPASEGHRQRGAAWLTRGLARFVEGAARSALGVDTLANTRRWRTQFADRVSEPLRDLATHTGLDEADAIGSNSLIFLAADWLVTRAGERAILEYYRLLPSSDSWEAAFEGAFGIAIDDFYAEFEKYRAGL